MLARPTRTILTALALAVAAGSSAFAGPNEFGQRPPQDDQRQPQTPPEERKCVVNNSDFTANKTFVIELTNTCEQRYRCTVRAYIVNAAGPTRGEATLTLGPASAGAEARKVYVIRLRESYGEAHSSQSCEEI